MSKTYRFTFSQEFSNNLFTFSQLHSGDDRKKFKEAWKQWSDDNAEIITAERERLKTIGFDKDVDNKMYKSARYYYSKKSTEKKAPSQRRPYVSIPKDILREIDRHITNYIDNESFKPSTGYNMFCESCDDTLVTCKDYLTEKGMNTDDVVDKIKKTYKNRCFVIKRQTKQHMTCDTTCDTEFKDNKDDLQKK